MTTSRHFARTATFSTTFCMAMAATFAFGMMTKAAFAGTTVPSKSTVAAPATSTTTQSVTAPTATTPATITTTAPAVRDHRPLGNAANAPKLKSYEAFTLNALAKTRSDLQAHEPVGPSKCAANQPSGACYQGWSIPGGGLIYLGFDKPGGKLLPGELDKLNKALNTAEAKTLAPIEARSKKAADAKVAFLAAGPADPKQTKVTDHRNDPFAAAKAEALKDPNSPQSLAAKFTKSPPTASFCEPNHPAGACWQKFVIPDGRGGSKTLDLAFEVIHGSISAKSKRELDKVLRDAEQAYLDLRSGKAAGNKSFNPSTALRQQ